MVYKLRKEHQLWLVGYRGSSVPENPDSFEFLGNAKRRTNSFFNTDYGFVSSTPFIAGYGKRSMSAPFRTLPGHDDDDLEDDEELSSTAIQCTARINTESLQSTLTMSNPSATREKRMQMRRCLQIMLYCIQAYKPYINDRRTDVVWKKGDLLEDKLSRDTIRLCWRSHFTYGSPNDPICRPSFGDTFSERLRRPAKFWLHEMTRRQEELSPGEYDALIAMLPAVGIGEEG
ncbi:hypothetical protein BXZ70DRAFT_907870 [Cristinia sonorae]|uniref:Uncharacterized protein n=1 Tax=Cristinia sonorae TaxID=1940300 RepID=A0A8K0UMY3_9AGAR|nr:hypothetical protein BXZ70DRAFT_907870 [Cristinia sonorae]